MNKLDKTIETFNNLDSLPEDYQIIVFRNLFEVLTMKQIDYVNERISEAKAAIKDYEAFKKRCEEFNKKRAESTANTFHSNN